MITPRDRTPLHEAALHDDPAVITRLIERGADPDARNWSRKTPLHIAVSSGHLAAAAALIEAGADVNARDQDDWTPLHWATHLDESADALITVLIAAGANPHTAGQLGMTPLHWAASSGNPATIRALIQAAADPAAKMDELIARLTALRAAVGGGTEQTAGIHIGANPDLEAGDEYGKTPLHYATEPVRHDAIRTLIELGADVDARDNGGGTPLHEAAGRWDNPAACAALIELGAEVDARDKQNQTPLHKAAFRWEINPEIITLLILAGADRQARSNDGRTAADGARRRNNPRVIQALAAGRTTSSLPGRRQGMRRPDENQQG